MGNLQARMISSSNANTGLKLTGLVVELRGQWRMWELV